MCMEDYKLGRKMYTAFRFVIVADATEAPLLPASEKRVHITLHTASAFPARVAPLAGHVAANNSSFGVNAANPPLEFDVKDHGDVVQKEWFASGNGGACGIAILETFLKDE